MEIIEKKVYEEGGENRRSTRERRMQALHWVLSVLSSVLLLFGDVVMGLVQY